MRMFQTQSPYRQGEAPYDIFKDRMAAIGSLVEGIKGIILGKYNKGLIDTTIGQLNKALSKDQQTDMINLLTTDPTDIYPDDEKLNMMAGQFVDYANLAAKEKRMGMPVGEMGQVTKGELGLPPPGTPTSEVMLPKGDKAQLLNAIMNMPEGQMDWQPVLNYMKEHRPSMMGSISPTEQFALNQAMGQIGDPQEELTKDIETASLLEQYLATPEEEKANSEIALFQKSKEEYVEYIKLKNSLIGEKKTAWETEAETLFKWYEDDIITVDEFKKGMGIYIAPEKMSDFDKKFDLASKMGLTVNEWKKFFGVYLGEEEGASKVQYFETAEECVAKADKIEGMTVDPTHSAKGYYPQYVKKTKEDPNNYLFGKKDVYGNISRMGIIPYDAQMQISYGQPLTDIQKTQIKNNHNLQKSLLDEKMIIQVEKILQQIGIDLGETPTEIMPEPSPEPKPKEWWEFWKSGEEQPIIPKVPTEEKEALIPTMSNDELYNALKGLDPSDPIYKSLYDEAVKRGLIAK